MNLAFKYLVPLIFIANSVTHSEALVVHPPVSGLATSEHNQVRLRSTNERRSWQSAFAWETRCKKILKNSKAYFDTLAD
jgi:hypothetical protein